MSEPRVPRALRWIASLLIRGQDAAFILADLDDSFERETARGIPPGRALRRYVVNLFGSALSVWRARLSVRNFRASWLDVKLGLRMLRKQPGLTAAAVFALAVGIPVGLAPMHAARVFEMPPPFEDWQQIQILKNFNTATSDWRSSTMQDFELWRNELKMFEALGASSASSYNVISEDGRAEPVQGAQVTASTFGILRVQPLLGRPLVESDELNGGPAVVVVGYDLWHSRLGGDPGVVGRTIRIGGVPHSVVGVMPEGFLFPIRGGLWLPLRNDALTEGPAQRGYRVFGRLADGISPEQVQAELTVIGQRMAGEFPETHARVQPRVMPFTVGLYGTRGGLQAEPGFYIFQMLALLVLVVACANVGMLIFTRTATRSQELAVRTALGASRARVVSQLFVESLVLAVLAAGLGLLVADRIASSRLDWLVELTPPWFDLGVTRWTVGWALSLAVFSAGIIGVVPALKFTSKNVQRNMQNAGAGRSGVRFGGMSSALIIADVTLAVATMAFAVGLANSITESRDGGTIGADHFLSAEFRIPNIEPAVGVVAPDSAVVRGRVGETQQALVRRLKAAPEVRGVAVGSVLPGMDHRSRRIELDGETSPDAFEGHQVKMARVDIDFFDALEQPILNGRGFNPADLGENRSAIIVNTSFVDDLLGGQNALGRRVRYTTQPDSTPGPWYQIVGVVGSLGMGGTGEIGNPGLYHALVPGEANPVFLALHLGENPASFTPQLRALASEVDPIALVSDPKALSEVFSFDKLVTDWIVLGAQILVGILLALSISGIYALMSFTVTDRTREIGIRSALGSTRGGIVLNIAKRALVQLGVGVVLGTTIAVFLLSQLKQLGGIPTHSPFALSLAIGVGVTALIGALACTAPTLRALKIMPTEALRSG